MVPVPVYTPPEGIHTPLEDFTEFIQQRHRIRINSYHELHDFSVNRMNDFWMAFWDFGNIKASRHPTKAVDESSRIDEFPPFFENAKLNFAENIICGKDDDLAIISINEQNLASPETFTWSDMKTWTAKYASALRAAGIDKGDYMVSIGSNCFRSLAILLAAASIGAIIANFATDIGQKALEDRLDQLRPKLIIAETLYSYNGKMNDIQEKIESCFTTVSKKSPCQLVVIELDDKINCEHDTFEAFIARATDIDPRYEQVAFNHPLLVMFSSGTTGPPKGIVHGHGGLILNGYKEHLLHNGFGPEDLHIHFSNIGWTLWNISLGALFCKTPMILYDGSPFYPTPNKLLQTLFSFGITGFGGGPRYFAELQKHNVRPRAVAPKLKSICSTGAVLTSSLAIWVAEAFGPVCQIQMSGGTELCGSFFHGTRSLPSYPGEIAVEDLGMDMDVFTDEGKSAPEGERGELVCKKPFPNMPVMFLNDPDRKRYRAAYFEGFPHVWTHGDFVQVNPETKGTYVLGRSDGVLNPSGIRFGSAEIYTVLEAPTLKKHIQDALVVGQQRSTSRFSDSTERVILFIKCAPTSTSGSLTPSNKLVAQIKERIIKNLSRRHVPHFFFEVDEIPYNVNGKKLETLVKKVLNGGSEARAKLKMTEDEARMMQKYEKFYDVDAVFKRQGRNSKL